MPKFEKMSKSRGNVIRPEEVVFGIYELDSKYEFRNNDSEVIDYKKFGVWRDKFNTNCFFTSTRFGSQPIWLCLINDPTPCVFEINGETVIQHEDMQLFVDEQG